MRQADRDLCRPFRQCGELSRGALPAGDGPVDAIPGQLTAGAAAIAAARAAIGTPFRAHGREAGVGLDCVGLAALAAGAAGFAGGIPRGYALRRGDGATVMAMIDAAGLPRGRGAPGELVLARTAPRQLHLAITTESGVVHACALLRRVVERPGPLPWPVLNRWAFHGGME